MIGAPQRVRARAIKLATGELAGACGGQEAAAAITGKSQSQVQRCCSINDDTSFINARDLALLEAHAGVQPVTELLCKLAGGVFMPLPDPNLGEGDALPLQVIALAEEVGDVSHAVREALRDATITGRELGEIEKQYDELIAKAVEGRAMVRAMQGKDAVQPIPINRQGLGAD